MNISQAKEMRVLVVDDEVLAKGYLKYSLEELGFQNIEYVETANQALAAIRRQAYQLIVCAYDLKYEQEGYFFYEQIKNQHILPATTAFVFISADTAADIVHSIVELQPDEFLAKPFTVRDLDRRVSRVLQRKRVLAPVYQRMEEHQYGKALNEIETFLTNPANAEWFPVALKTKGDLLMACEHISQAKEFYQAIINVQNFAWAQLGLAQCLIYLNEDADAERLILELALKSDSKLAAYDLLSALQIKHKAFEDALECMLIASEISPRNIDRHRRTYDLSRLTHDYQTQFDAARKIVKYAKHSIHDKPEIYLNVARAGIDFAMTTEDADAARLVKQANDYLRQMTAAFPNADTEDQVKVIDARIMYLRNETDNARALLNQLSADSWESESEEALLDRAKAFHEVGLQEHALKLLDEVERRCRTSPDNRLFTYYIRQEKLEKTEIALSPKELNNAAVHHYKSGDMKKSLSTFSQAFRVMPKNPAIALNLLQAAAVNRRSHRSRYRTSPAIIHKCQQTIESVQLNDDQERRYQRVKDILKGLA